MMVAVFVYCSVVAAAVGVSVETLSQSLLRHKNLVRTFLHTFSTKSFDFLAMTQKCLADARHKIQTSDINEHH